MYDIDIDDLISDVFSVNIEPMEKVAVAAPNLQSLLQVDEDEVLEVPSSYVEECAIANDCTSAEALAQFQVICNYSSQVQDALITLDSSRLELGRPVQLLRSITGNLCNKSLSQALGVNPKTDLKSKRVKQTLDNGENLTVTTVTNETEVNSTINVDGINKSMLITYEEDKTPIFTTGDFTLLERVIQILERSYDQSGLSRTNNNNNFSNCPAAAHLALDWIALASSCQILCMIVHQAFLLGLARFVRNVFLLQIYEDRNIPISGIG